MCSHAATPIAESLGNGLFRIYFSLLDEFNRSYTSYALLDIDSPNKILDLSTKPVLAPGNLGEFDDSGSTATWLTSHRGSRLLYYVGWNLGVIVPFRNSIGLAFRKEIGEFGRYSSGPILDRSMREPHFCGSCCVMPGEDVWRFWYLSCPGWHIREQKPRLRYHIKYAESNDGIHWKRNGLVAIDYKRRVLRK